VELIKSSERWRVVYFAGCCGKRYREIENHEMLSGIDGREARGCGSVKTEPFIIVRITQNEDSGPAFAASAVHCAPNQSRSDTTPLSSGLDRYGARANAGNGASILDSRT
jgi:hypothetical protein